MVFVKRIFFPGVRSPVTLYCLPGSLERNRECRRAGQHQGRCRNRGARWGWRGRTRRTNTARPALVWAHPPNPCDVWLIGTCCVRLAVWRGFDCGKAAVPVGDLIIVSILSAGPAGVDSSAGNSSVVGADGSRRVKTRRSTSYWACPSNSEFMSCPPLLPAEPWRRLINRAPIVACHIIACHARSNVW